MPKSDTSSPASLYLLPDDNSASTLWRVTMIIFGTTFCYLLCFNRLLVALYHYIAFRFVRPITSPVTLSLTNNLPLTTSTKSERERLSMAARVDQFYSILATHAGPHTLAKTQQLCTRDVALRRVINLIVFLHDKTTDLHIDERLGFVLNVYKQVLVAPPPLTHTSSAPSGYDVSVIVPAYCENTPTLLVKIRTSMLQAVNPLSIELIVVDAGKNGENFKSVVEKDERLTRAVGLVKVVTFTEGGGRGPALNFGVKQSCGKYLTFLHADSLLPIGWDLLVREHLKVRGRILSATQRSRPASRAAQRASSGPIVQSDPRVAVSERLGTCHDRVTPRLLARCSYWTRLLNAIQEHLRAARYPHSLPCHPPLCPLLHSPRSYRTPR